MVILFDGVCNLCNGFVQYIIRLDRKKLFKFASLQSNYACVLVKENTLPPTNLSTVILRQGGRFYFKSTAVLRLARELGFPYPLLYAFILIPRPLRDFIYRWVATNRYKWFGQRNECMLPTPELKSRFLD